MRDRTPPQDNVIFGIHPVREALRSGKNRVEKIFVSQDRRDARLGEVMELARARGIPITRLTSPLFRRLFGVRGLQSLAAQVASVPFEDPDELIDSAEKGLFLVIDEVTDPRNLGSIFRSAAAAGVDGVLLPTRHVAPISPTVEKASAGGVNYVRTARVTNLVNLIKTFNERGVQTVGLVPGAPKSYLDVDLTIPTALVVGGEERGVRRLIRENCRETASIPMSGPLQSLNVSVATAVVLYEALRQRRREQLG